MWNFLNLETPCGLNKTLGGHSTAWARLLSRTQLKSLGGREAAGLWSRQHGAVGMIWSSTHLTLHLPKACSACTGPCPPHPPTPHLLWAELLSDTCPTSLPRSPDLHCCWPGSDATVLPSLVLLFLHLPKCLAGFVSPGQAQCTTPA